MIRSPTTTQRFLESDDGRPLRILSEYLRPLGVFRRRRVHDTIVFFGSARIPETGPLSEYYAAARELARLVTEWSEGLESPAHRYLVCTGGGPGIMEAANRGAQDAGGRTIGLNIGLPHEQRPNPFITPGLGFEFRYFFMRKLWFAYLARAIVVFPGGFGTLDELFEFLTLSQTGKLDPPVATLLYGTELLEGDRGLRRPGPARHDRRRATSGCCTSSTRRRRRSPCSASACGRRPRPSSAPAIARSVTLRRVARRCEPARRTR